MNSHEETATVPKSEPIKGHTTHSDNIDASREEERGSEYPKPFILGLVMVNLCIATFLVGLDQTIVATAAPKITKSFNALGDIAWWTSAYLLTSSTMQLAYGRLYTLFPTKHVYNTAIIVFAIGSLICTTAPKSVALIVGRAIAGCGAAGIFSGSVLILAASCPLEKRASYTGLLFMSLGISAIVGPFIGGALADRATWRWCFGINLPICAIIVLSTCLLVHTPADEKTRKMTWREKVEEFDLPGTILLTASLVCIILALQLGGSQYPWSSGRVVALFVVASVIFLVFLSMQIWLPKHRSFSSTIIGNRNVAIAATYSGFISGGMFVIITYLPIWFQAVKGANALRSGVMTAPLIIAFIVMPILSGALTQGLGYYNPAMILGATLSAIGAGLLGTLTTTSLSSRWIGFQVLYGLGAGAGVPPPMLVVQTVLTPNTIPMGVSLVNLTQMLWSSIVVAIAQTVFINKLEEGIFVALPGFDAKAISKSFAAQLDTIYSSEQLRAVLPAYSNAVTKTFFITTALSCAALLLMGGLQWKSMKAKTS
ncbi:MFS general substrate transporter [Periconia macrospinosa]|uniref:MFS general substrate transporter n=1 Tax=Periconia macrospinosa TaxID=97972 RepID=A0A2V1DWG5_9PLEO|nr:MFS general substrate transporter [Periconia macrospinosa]